VSKAIDPPERFEALAVIAHILAHLGVPYAVVGSTASARWGEPRMTNDLDILVELRLSDVAPFVRSLSDDFHVDPDLVEEAVRGKRSFNVLSRSDLTKVDIFVADGSRWHRSQLARRQSQELPGFAAPDRVYIASAEDTVLAKLVWYEKGNRVSDRQWRDVRSILRVQGATLDRSYLREFAAELRVRELLDRAFAETAPRIER
jgi:hypothetical protein